MRYLFILCITMLNTVLLRAEDNALPHWALGDFMRPEGANPIISPNPLTTFACPMTGKTVKWECADTFNPAAVVKDGQVCILYRAEDNPDVGIGKRTSRIGLAVTSDGVYLDFRSPTPVMYPDESEMSHTYDWTGGTEDPRVVEAEVDGKRLFVMTYTAWDRKTARLAIATSTDLITWTHHGPAFRTAFDGKFNTLFCKSGSIVTEVRNGRLMATRVQVAGGEHYLMYWGENWVCAAISDDLIHWTPITEGADNSLRYLARPRNGFFDSQLTECGPPAVKTRHGIVLLYNGKNKSGNNGDPNYAANTYAAGQMLFSLDNPLKLIDRLDKPFFYPMADFEKSGQYAAGTVFIEGLVFFRGKWFLYYGCADSKVGVAVCNPRTKNKKQKNK